MLRMIKNWCKTTKRKKRLSKIKIKTKLYVTKIFDNDLVAIRESKVIIKLNKPPCVEMCNLDLNKVLMYEFCYDYIKNKFGSKSEFLFKTIIILIVWCTKSKPKMIIKALARIKNCLILVIIQLSQKIMMIQKNKLLIRWKMKRVVLLLKI